MSCLEFLRAIFFDLEYYGVTYTLAGGNLGLYAGGDMVTALMEHDHLVSASCSFRATIERKFSVPEESGSQSSVQAKCVYVFQREYAIVDPALVEKRVLLF
ncbi:Protein N-terminal asparagine amidohydrolase [Artemisia annua]|uniref:Protein N-terminal asparagine amidohydrolase n=1 Tax=Artemisia annua TaxID=35608 RepID=A0A2U1KFS9_ARTAN|nr:Protein N-terminal asparagine amidohydrolase [Artemisia annua]